MIRWEELSPVLFGLWQERPDEFERLVLDARKAWSAGQRCEVVGRARLTVQHPTVPDDG